jgi:SSS family solute:Na+ symporter
MPEFTVTALDIALVVAYILGTIGVALWVSRRTSDDSEGYFLGGRSFIWPLVGLSLYASNISGTSFVGFAAAGYQDGVPAYNYEWTAAFIIIFFVFFIYPFYMRSRVQTVPEFLERRYDTRTRRMFSGFNVLANLFLDAAGGLFAGAVVVQVVYPDVPLWVSVGVFALLAGAYTVVGGLAAVIVTDAIQAVTLIIGGTIVAVLAFGAAGSWAEIQQAAPANAFSIVRPPDDPAMPWPGLFTGVFLIYTYYFALNQMIVQRTLAAKNADHGRWGALFAGLIKLPNLLIMLIPGIIAVGLYPNLESPNLAFPTLVFDLVPIGLRGVVIAALLAGIISSIDSVLNSVSTLVSLDFVRPLGSDLSEHATVRIGRVVTVAFMLLAWLLSSVIVGLFPTLFDYLQSFLAYITPPVLVVFIGGIFWRGARARGAFWTLALGVPVGLVLWVVSEIAFPDTGVQFLYACGLLVLANAAVFVGLSMTSDEAEKEDLDDLTWNTATWRAETEELRGVPWYANYRILSIGLAIVTMAFVVPIL